MAAAAMPEIPLTRVVSVSSADPRHPAENLLRPDDGGRWRGAAGEKQMSVVLELGDPRPIHSLHIGNDGAAFIEVLGGSSAGGDFQVLLPSAALMSPSESRAGAEPRRVRLFGPESLLRGQRSPGTHLGTPGTHLGTAGTHLGHTWDRLKVVLSQPYCQSRPYGLSFIRVFTEPREEETAPRRRLGPFTLREEGEGSPRRPPGALFYRRPSPTPAPPRDPSPGPSYATAALRGTGDGGQPPPKRHLPPPKTNGTPPKKPKSSSGTPPPKPGAPPKDPKILGGVVLALSGFQNPLRGHLRAAAAALGAEYRPDWTEECTHLVCAFSRTPKARRARQRGGVVVTPGWIWECQRQGRRVGCEP